MEVTFTISDNVKGYLLVAEIFHGDERAIEMRSVPTEPSVAPAPAGITIMKKLLWEQSAPILDVALVADFMFVLDTAGVSRYERRDGKWDRVGVLPVASSVRDPRGKLDLEGDSLTVQLPGTTCRGTWNPSVSLHCDAGSMLDGGSQHVGECGVLAGAFLRSSNQGRVCYSPRWTGGRMFTTLRGRPLPRSRVGARDFVAIQDGCAANRIAAHRRVTAIRAIPSRYTTS